MDAYTDDMSGSPVQGEMSVVTTDAPEGPDEATRKLVGQLTERIRADKKHHEKAFKRMREDMVVARLGAPKEAGADEYVVNITGRHINQKVAALYAKNPKAVARRRDRLDFQLWDETEQSLLAALDQVMMATQPQVDPATGVAVPPNPMAAMDPAFMQAKALVQDYQMGMEARKLAERVGKTLEILFAYYTNEQTPLDFKSAMKRLVRRACTTGVGYVKLGFQRDMEEQPGVSERLADFRRQLAHMQELAVQAQDDTRADREVRQRELELQVASLQEQQYVLMREGLVFDFPDSTRVIPDKLTRSLVGFDQARWITLEYLYTPSEVKELFGVDLKTSKYVRYSDDGATNSDADQPELNFGDEETRGDMVCVWEHYDRQSGTVYLLIDGHSDFVRPPGPPAVYVEDFWPVFALTFNEVEDPKCLFPPSDVRLMMPMQREWNRAGQGKAEHRKAARPRFISRKGALDDESKILLQNAEAFTVTEINPLDGSADINGIVAVLPMPGVDPNLYETGTIFNDIQLSIGVQEAAFGAVANATATESSIAESSRIASVDSNVDDLDAFLSRLARAAGQVMLKEVSEQTVREIAGPGAVWPRLTIDQIAKEIYLEVVAGSSGKPNQAQDIRVLKELLPFIIQMPGINPVALAKEVLRRYDDRLDIMELILPGNPAIVAMNRMAGAAPAPGAMPEDQGGAGADNTRQTGGPTGTDAAMGNNQQPV